MKHKLVRFCTVAAATALLSVTTLAHATLSLSNVPLFVTTGVQPNVMIEFDDSGSMDNILWDAGFNPAVTYPDWSVAKTTGVSCGNNATTKFACQNGISSQTDPDAETSTSGTWPAGVWNTSTGSNIYPSTSCPSGYILGRKVVVHSTGSTNSPNNADRYILCVKIPNPGPSDGSSHTTRYLVNYINYLFETEAGSQTAPTAAPCNNSVSNLTANCYTYANTDLTASNLTTALIPSTTRIQSARTVATNIVTNNPNLRFGLTSFNPATGNTDADAGGSIDAPCGSTTATLTSTISAYRAVSWTPLAETYYEITRYFRGLSHLFGSGSGNYTSPIQYRCQKNFIIVVTDGFPTYDNNLPAANVDPDDLADTAHAFPNWDNLAPATTQAQYPTFPQYSDGFFPNGGSQQSEGYTLYMDDMAKFAFDTDMRKGGTDATGTSFDATDFPKQNIDTYTVGLATNNQMLIDAAAYGNGQNYNANNEAALSAAMQLALADIAAKTSSASSVATNSTRLTTNSAIYQARFSTGDWSGQLLALAIQSDGSVASSPTWNAATVLPAAASRNILSYNPGAAAGSRGIAFQWASLNATQQLALNQNSSGTPDALGSNRVGYLRGDAANESPNGSGFRPRAFKLGDIVNSDPVFVGNTDFGFAEATGISEGSSYAAFLSSNSSRTPMVYVGANDGMLHGFNSTNGVELMAYVPDAIIPNLKYLTDTNYNNAHKYLVDGSPTVSDAYVGGAWKTMLIGSLGAGGRGVFTLDITSPTSFGTTNVKWEFTSAQDTDMGYAIPQPAIARMANGSWAAIVPNGYNSTSEKAVLFILDLSTGAVLKKLNTNVGSSTASNGLSSVAPIDQNGDGVVDYIYAGDLQGNMWKFDVTDTTATNWNIALSGTPLFIDCATTGTPPCAATDLQPITDRPDVILNPSGGFVVLFGTGRYFVSGDNNTTGAQTETFYGIRDHNLTTGQTTISGRQTLQQQTVTATTTASGQTLRTVSNSSLTAAQNGWYLDLPTAGERVVANPQIRGGRIIFTSLIPSTDPCGFGGTSYLYELDALTGSRLNFAAFDVNGDGQFNQSDFVNGAPASGILSNVGIIKTPTFISNGSIEYGYASGTSGNIFKLVGNAGKTTGRQSWRQLQ